MQTLRLESVEKVVLIVGGLFAIIASLIGVVGWTTGYISDSVVRTVLEKHRDDFNGAVADAIETHSESTDAVRAVANKAIYAHVSNADFMKEVKQRLDYVSKNFDEYIEKIDSGYTYRFSLSNDGFPQKNDFRFFAEPERQEVFVFLIGREGRVVVGRDVEVKINGTPFRVNGELYEGELTGYNISPILSATTQGRIEKKLHKINVNELGSEDGIPSRGKPVRTFPVDLMILVKNDLRAAQ